MYKYKVVNIEDLDAWYQEEDFNELGKENWQLVCVTDKYAYFWRYKKVEDEKKVAYALDMDMIEHIVSNSANEYERAFLEE